MTRRRGTTSAAAIGAFALVTAVFACGSSGDPLSSGAASGSSSGATEADGGGVCCRLGNPCIDDHHGGWAPSADECREDPHFKGTPGIQIDSNGCRRWIMFGGTWPDDLGERPNCGGLPVPPEDAGPDGANGKSCPSTKDEALAQCASQSSCFPDGVRCTYAADPDGGMDAGADAGMLVVECATKWTCSWD